MTKEITIDQLADFIDKHWIVDSEGKSFYGDVYYHITAGKLGYYKVEQIKKTKGGDIREEQPRINKSG